MIRLSQILMNQSICLILLEVKVKNQNKKINSK